METEEIIEKFKLEGKTALVSGCTRGIGLAMAEGLAEAGADIIGVSSSLKSGSSEIRSRVEELGRKFQGYTCDFGDRKALYEFIRDVKQGAPIDILVNNAGTTARIAAAEHADEDWDRVIEVNLNAHFILTREIASDMLARGYGKIIFTASMLTFQGGITVPSYAASKGGIGQLTKALANEWAAQGVNVNAVAPGYIVTDLTAALTQDPKRNQAILERIPAGRWGLPEDIKGAVVFLASSASDYLHGTILPVDGGWLVR